MHLIERFPNNYTAFGVSAMEGAVGRSVLCGRPFGGVSTLVRGDILKNVKCLKISERFVILLFCNIIILNVYLPYKCGGSSNLLISTLEEIDLTLALYSDCVIVCGGDFNCEIFSADDHHSRIINKFMSSHDLVLCNNYIKPNCNYTYMHKTLERKSMVDYFIISSKLVPGLIRNCVRDEIVNLSDHFPVSISITLPVSPNFLLPPPPSPRVYWAGRRLPLLTKIPPHLLPPLADYDGIMQTLLSTII